MHGGNGEPSAQRASGIVRAMADRGMLDPHRAPAIVVPPANQGRHEVRGGGPKLAIVVAIVVLIVAVAGVGAFVIVGTGHHRATPKTPAEKRAAQREAVRTFCTSGYHAVARQPAYVPKQVGATVAYQYGAGVKLYPFPGRAGATTDLADVSVIACFGPRQELTSGDRTCRATTVTPASTPGGAPTTSLSDRPYTIEYRTATLYALRTGTVLLRSTMSARNLGCPAHVTDATRIVGPVITEQDTRAWLQAHLGSGSVR